VREEKEREAPPVTGKRTTGACYGRGGSTKNKDKMSTKKLFYRKANKEIPPSASAQQQRRLRGKMEAARQNWARQGGDLRGEGASSGREVTAPPPRKKSAPGGNAECTGRSKTHSRAATLMARNPFVEKKYLPKGEKKRAPRGKRCENPRSGSR